MCYFVRVYHPKHNQLIYCNQSSIINFKLTGASQNPPSINVKGNQYIELKINAKNRIAPFLFCNKTKPTKNSNSQTVN